MRFISEIMPFLPLPRRPGTCMYTMGLYIARHLFERLLIRSYTYYNSRVQDYKRVKMMTRRDRAT